MYVNSPVTGEPYSNLIVPQFYTSVSFYMHFGISLALQLDLTACFLMVNLRRIKPQDLTFFIYKTREHYRKAGTP